MNGYHFKEDLSFREFFVPLCALNLLISVNTCIFHVLDETLGLYRGCFQLKSLLPDGYFSLLKETFRYSKNFQGKILSSAYYSVSSKHPESSIVRGTGEIYYSPRVST